MIDLEQKKKEREKETIQCDVLNFLLCSYAIDRHEQKKTFHYSVSFFLQNCRIDLKQRKRERKKCHRLHTTIV